MAEEGCQGFFYFLLLPLGFAPVLSESATGGADFLIIMRTILNSVL